MSTFLLERVTPPAFSVRDPDQVALHSRWAADAYHEAGIVWFGGVATDDGRMFSLVVAESASDVERYCASLGIARTEFTLRNVIANIGPNMAMSKSDPRYRSPRM